MTDLNDYFFTDGVDDVMAAHVNQLTAGNLRGELTNTQTLTGTLTLNDASFPIQNLTPSGADRAVLLAPEASTNHHTIFRNAGSVYNLIIQDDSGATTFATLLPGEVRHIVPIGGSTWTTVSKSHEASNELINGGFDVVQRQTPGTLTTIAQDKYSADRWRCSRENADLQFQQADGTGEAGLTSMKFGTFKKITNAGKLMIYQIIEGVNSIPLRGKTVMFSIQMKASSARTMRMAVIELQTAGAIDTIPATFVTAWGANTVDPTLGANLAIVTGAQSKAVTTAMQVFSVIVTVPATSKNLICAVWSDSQFAANDTLSLAEAGLYYGVSTGWRMRPIEQELELCQRYYCKSFPLTTAPAQNAGFVGAIRRAVTNAGAVGTSWNGAAEWQYPVVMRAVPTATFFNTSAANGFVRNSTLGTDATGTGVGGSNSERAMAIICTGLAAWAVGNESFVHATAEAEL